MANLVLTTECNGTCGFCFAQGTHTHIERMKKEDMDAIGSFLSLESNVNLIGGEPSLHPDILEIVGILKKHIQNLFLVTNFMGPTEVFEGLLQNGCCHFLVNIHASEQTQNEKLRERFLNHLNMFRRNRYQITLATTIYSLEQNHDWLLKLIREDKNQCIVGLRVSPSVPTKSNQHMLTSQVGDVWLDIVKKVHQINPHILIHNDCLVINRCMMTDDVYLKLKDTVARFEFGACSGECCPFDILPDFSVRYCYGTYHNPHLMLENIFAYQNIIHARNEMQKRLHYWMHSGNLKFCSSENCEAFSCKGWCPAIITHFQEKN